MNLRHRRATVLGARAAVVGAVAALSVAVTTAPASALNTGHENQMSKEVCKNYYDSKFKFTLFHNSNQAGSYRNIGYSVGNFADERIGGAAQGGTQPLKFCGGKGKGSGANIKNNAASAKNRHTQYTAYVYYNSWYKGATDPVVTGVSRNLSKTYNQNASFQWRS